MKASKFALLIATALATATAGSSFAQAAKATQSDATLPNQPAPFNATQPPARNSAQMPSTASHSNMTHDGMKKSMMTGMEGMQKMSMSGDIDKDFAMMMKMHHQQGVEMAEMELANGKSPEMKTMARNIIASQKKEIAQFDKWLAKQK